MPWSREAPRRARLPRDWKIIVKRILLRDPTCKLNYRGICTVISTQVDHVDPMTDDHSDHRLQGVCAPCHAHKSALEGNAAKAKRKRPAERHPGLL